MKNRPGLGKERDLGMDLRKGILYFERVVTGMMMDDLSVAVDHSLLDSDMSDN